MAGEVIDLLQDLGLPPPQSRGRLIFPLQMENKLPFKHMKRGANDWESRRRVRCVGGGLVQYIWTVKSLGCRTAKKEEKKKLFAYD